MYARSLTFAGVAACVMASGALHGATWTSSGEASWDTPGNWDTGVTPDVGVDGWNATLNSGTAVYTGDTFRIPGAGAALTLNGGSFRLEGTAGKVDVFWGGALNANSGTFDIGARSLYIGGGTTGTLHVAGGSVKAATGFLLNNGGSSAYISDGQITLTSDFNLQNGTFTMSGGELNARYISFYDPANSGMVLDFSGGRMNLTGGIWSYDTSKSYIDFSADSTGVIFFAGDLSGDSANWAIRNGSVRVDGVTDYTLFQVTTDLTGTSIQLVAVPEPASAMLLALPMLLSARRKK